MFNKTEAEIIQKYKNATNRLVLLDYDGTLVNYTIKPDTARLPEHTFDILIDFLDDPKTKIYIITGRRQVDIDRLLNHIPIDIIAEHGAMIKEKGIWRKQLVDNFPWKNEIIPILNRFTVKCPGSFVEEKIFSIAWHYRNADPEMGYADSREIIDLLRRITDSRNLKILDGKKVVEILTKDTGKGRAVKKLIEQNSFDFVLSIGDDATDEEMFEYLLPNPDAFTIKVGEGSTYARHKVKNIGDVVTILKLLLR